MLRNHITIAWRNILKHKLVSTINICGLAIGLATCLTIMLFVEDELSYDRYNEHADRIVRVLLKGKISDELISEAVTPSPVAKTLQQEFPEVVYGTRLIDRGIPKISSGFNTQRDGKLALVDNNFFKVFTLPMIKGNPGTALKEPNSIVITSKQALKYFGDQDPIGKVLEIEEEGHSFKVTGIIDEVPVNSHFHFDLFASLEGRKDEREFKWVQSEGYSYLLLKEGSGVKDLELKLPIIVEKFMGPQIQQALGMTFVEFKDNGNDVGLFLQPLLDIHLRSNLTEQSQLEEGGSIKTVYIFVAVALFILILACINFMNLSTSLATKRAKEVGVKKVLGSEKKQLVVQFLMESIVVTALAIALAFLLIILALPYFNLLSTKALQVSHLVAPKAIVYLFIFGLMTSLLAGSYPAFVLSSFRPIAALKTKTNNTPRNKGIRGGLVVFQFAISVTLIVATLIADQQLSFILNKDLGYDKDRILVIRESYYLGDKEGVFKDKLIKDSRVENITRSGYIPAGLTNSGMFNIYPDPNSESFRRTVIYNIDDRYLPTLGMTLKAGRNFSEDPSSEFSNTIINETAAKLFGIADDPIDRIISLSTDNDGGKRDLTVIGVVKDFHFKSLHTPVEPLFMLNNANQGLIIRAATADMSGLISHIQDLWNEFELEEPFNYSLLDESYRRVYHEEQRLRGILQVFTLVTIFVACLGLFGLVTFTTEQRFKEIGIRKVLGSSVFQVVSMLARDFLKLVFGSFLIAFPLGYFLMNKWLQDFAYRIEIDWWVFVLAATSTLLVAMVTVGIKSVKAGLANPVDSLRNE